jgi:hypothetical protein
MLQKSPKGWCLSFVFYSKFIDTDFGMFEISIGIFSCTELENLASFACCYVYDMTMRFPSCASPNFIPQAMSGWLVDMGQKCAENTPEKFRSWFISRQWPVEIGETCAKNYVLPSWPEIVLSEDDPPAFAELDSPKKKDRYYDFEEWLGCYCWGNKRITIWIKGVQKASEDLKVPYLDLFNCVLIHELGHWFNHLAPVPGGRLWPEDAIESYKYDRTYNEVWAQLFTWLYGHQKDEGVLEAFKILERWQSPPYKAWRILVSKDQTTNIGCYQLTKFLRPILVDPEKCFKLFRYSYLSL